MTEPTTIATAQVVTSRRACTGTQCGQKSMPAQGVGQMGLPIQIILTRQLAGYLSVPLFLVDPKGDLLFYNEPAEAILGRRFDETGAMPAAVWSSMLPALDDRGQPIPPAERPLMITVTQHRPVYKRYYPPRHERRAAADRGCFDPDHRPARRVSGRGGSVLGDQSDHARDPVRHPRLGRRTGTGDRPLRRQHLDRGGAGRRRHAPAARRRHRHPSSRGADPEGDQAGRHPPDPSPHGPHPGPGLLRPALQSRDRGPHLGAGERHALARGPPLALPLAALVPGSPA